MKRSAIDDEIDFNLREGAFTVRGTQYATNGGTVVRELADGTLRRKRAGSRYMWIYRDTAPGSTDVSGPAVAARRLSPALRRITFGSTREGKVSGEPCLAGSSKTITLAEVHMAVWQFVVDLFPASAATVGGAAAARMSREQLDAIELEFTLAQAKVLLERVGALLPNKASWAPDLRTWGNEKTDDAQISFQGDAIEHAQFRLNVPDLSMSLVQGICSLARDLDCVLATRTGVIVQPSSEAVIRAITQSDAARFVRDPERFLRDIADQDRRED